MVWRLNGSVGRVPRDGTAWPALELRQVDATLDTSALKVCRGECDKNIDLFVLFI